MHNNKIDNRERRDSMGCFQYGKKEMEYLKKADKALGAAIEEIGMVERVVTEDVFQALISSVIGQQVSIKAAKTVESRLLKIIGSITPENLERIDIDTIQKCGMSFRKAGYIKGIGEAALLNEIDFNSLHKLSNEEVVKKLSSLHGVGEWTAEMILISGLQRPDIVSYKDLGIRRAMMTLYGLDELSKTEFDKYRKRYSPYGTVASIYLWELSKK